MTDLVERLRSVTRLMRKTEEVTYHQDDGLALEAADTITALRAEVEQLTGERDRQYDQNAEQITRIAALEAENERLRAALKRINVGFVSAKDAPAEHDEAIRIASSALEEKP